MVNFCAKAKEVKEGWQNIKSPEQTYEGPLSKHCGCGHSHQLLSLSKAKETNISPSVCAHFLQSLPRLIEERGHLNTVKLRGNGAYFFSPLSDSDCPGHFLLLQQPRLQARWRAWQESRSQPANAFVVNERCTMSERCRKRQGEEEGTGNLQFQHLLSQARSLEELEGGAKRARVVGRGKYRTLNVRRCQRERLLGRGERKVDSGGWQRVELLRGYANCCHFHTVSAFSKNCPLASARKVRECTRTRAHPS